MFHLDKNNNNNNTVSYFNSCEIYCWMRMDVDNNDDGDKFKGHKKVYFR